MAWTENTYEANKRRSLHNRKPIMVIPTESWWSKRQNKARDQLQARPTWYLYRFTRHDLKMETPPLPKHGLIKAPWRVGWAKNIHRPPNYCSFSLWRNDDVWVICRYHHLVDGSEGRCFVEGANCFTILFQTHRGNLGLLQAASACHDVAYDVCSSSNQRFCCNQWSSEAAKRKLNHRFCCER